MKIGTTLSAVLLTLVAAGHALAQPIFFGDPITADMIIDAGNPYPDGFGAYDAGGGSPKVELVEGGYVGNWAMLFDGSSLIMRGGEVGDMVILSNGTTLTITGGVIGEEKSPLLDTGNVSASGSSAIHLRGGRLVANYVTLFENSSLHIYGTNLELEPTGGGDFYVTGILQSGQPINLRVEPFGPQTSISLHVVPEPASRTLLLWAWLTLCRRQMRSFAGGNQ